MAKMVDPKTYAKNVLKSAGFIAASTIGGIDPSLSSYIKDNVASTKEMYRQVRDYKSTIRNKADNILGESGLDDLRQIKRNVLDDLRTGKFFNPEREAQNENSMLKSLGISFDFDDIDFDVDETVGEKVAEEAATSSSVASLTEKMMKSQQVSSATSTKNIIRGSKANTAAMIAHNEKMFGQLNSSLANIHSSILDMHRDLAGPLNTHIVNSANFYGVATTELSKQTALLQNIQKMMHDRFSPTDSGSSWGNKSSSNPWKTIMGRGLPDFKAWRTHAKNKLMNETGLDMLSGFDPEMFQMLLQTGMSSPIAMALSGIAIGRARNGAFGKGLNNMVNTIKGGFNHVAVKMSKYAKDHRNDSGIKGFLANLFDIVPSAKDVKVDLSKYNKGRADWTGMDSKALREVIPTQLAQILSALTGKEPKIFDYKSGKFITAKQARNDFNRSRNEAIGNASRDLRNDIINEFIEQDKIANRGRGVPELDKNSKAVRNLSRTYDTLVSMLSINNVDVSNFKNASDLINYCKRQRWVGNDLSNGNRDYIFDERSLRRLARILYRRGGVAGVQGRFEGAIINGKLTNAEMINDASNSVYGTIHNGGEFDRPNTISAIANILNNKDEYGNSVYFYLKSYYDQLKILVNRASGFGDNTYNTMSDGPDIRGAYTDRIRLTPINGSRERATAPTSRLTRASSDDDDSITDDERYVYNSATESYEAPRPTSSNTRRDNEKKSIFTKLFDKTNNFLDDLFYGNASAAAKEKIRAHGGMFGVIKDIPQIIKDVSKDLKEKFKDFVKDKWTKFKESEFGKRYFKEIKTSVKNFAKDTWSDAKYKAGSAVKFMTGKTPSWAAQMSGSRRGGVVQRSGMASVSEGEIIIPADQNPYYTGHMGNAARDSIERTNYKKWLKDGGNEDDFFGFFRKGTKRVQKKKEGNNSSKTWPKLSPDDKKTIEDMYNSGNTPDEIAKAIKRAPAQIQDYIRYLNAAGRTGRVVEDVKEGAGRVKDQILNSKSMQYVEELFHRATSKIDESLTRVFGDSTIYSDAKKYAAEAKKVAKENMPKTFADATIGGLIGAAATGSGIGLLGGMVIGAGTSIIKRSDTISKALFGEEDPVTGDYTGGMIPSKVTKFIKKRLPKVGKSAAIGGVLGTLGFAPGGIFGGMAIGAGLELVSTTDTFKDIMFGKPNVHGERTGGLMGSIRDHVVTPLINFTKDGLGKIGKYVKENFLKPIGSIFDPLKDWVRGKSRSVMDTIIGAAKETVKRTLGERINALFKPVANFAGWAGKKAIGAAGRLASAPFRAVGKMGEGLAAHNIRVGYSSKSAKERMAMEGTRMGVTGKFFGRKLKNTAYTKWASTASDEDIQAAAHYMNGANSYKRSIMTKRQDLADMITASLRHGGNLDPKIVKEIKKLFNTNKVIKDNNFSEIIQYITNLPEEVMGFNTKEAVLDKIDEYQASIQKDFDSRKSFKDDQDAFFNRIGLTSSRDRKKFMKHAKIQSQLDAEGIRKATGASEADAINKAKEKDDAAKLLKEQQRTNPIDAERNSLLHSILNVAIGIARHSGVSDSEIPKSNYSAGSYSGIRALSAPSISMRRSSGSVNDDGEAPEGTIKTIFEEGQPIQMVYHNGQWEHHMADSDTKRAVENSEEDRRIRNSFYNSWVNGGILDKFKGLFGSNKNEEKKETLWDKIKKIFSGGIGILGKLLPVILGALGIGIVGSVGSKSAGTGKDSGMNADTDPEARKEEVEGWSGISGLLKKGKLGIDSIENTIRGRNTTSYDSDDFVSEYATDSYATRMLKNAVIGLDPKMAETATKVTSKTIGKVPIVGKLLSGGLNFSTKAATNLTKLGKGASNIVEKIGNMTFDPTKKGISAIPQKLAYGVYSAADSIKNAPSKIFSAIKDSSVTKTAANIAAEAAKKVSSAFRTVLGAVIAKLGLKTTPEAIEKVVKETGEAIVKKAGKSVSKIVSKGFVVIYAAFIVNAVIEGFQSAKAKTILGILDEPTTGQRILAATCNGLNEAIPGIGGIIPTETLFSIVYTALEFLGCKFGKLAEQRAAAKKEVEEYNAENGTTYNIEEYIHNVKGEYTIQERIVKTTTSGISKVKSKISSVFDKIKSFFTGNKKDDSGSGSDTEVTEKNTIITDGRINSNYTRLNGSSSSSENKALKKQISTSFSGPTRTNTSRSKMPTFGQMFGKGTIGSGTQAMPSATATEGFYGSGAHTTQKGNYRPFGCSTIDKNGCGPASAVSVLRSYGKDLSVDNAATFAESGGYVAGDSGINNPSGTRASYFDDILGRNGISTSYTNSQSKIKAAVNSGSPTILLGQDKNNSSKSNSPFGPNPHYVVTRGTDRNGNVIVDDPELKGTALYKRDILNKAKLGIATAGKSNLDFVSPLAITSKVTKSNTSSNSDLVDYVKENVNIDNVKENINNGSLPGVSTKSNTSSNSDLADYVKENVNIDKVKENLDNTSPLGLVDESEEFSEDGEYFEDDSSFSDTSSSSSGGVAGLINSAFRGITSAISDKLGVDSVAGKIFNAIFSGLNESSDTSSDDGTYSDGEESTVVGGHSYFKILTSKPSANDPNIKCYNTPSNGGVSPCIRGNKDYGPDKVCDVLPNCVGWAWARFNQIYNLLSGTNNKMKYYASGHASSFVANAPSIGLKTGSTPQIGAIMCWGGGTNGTGHVAIVERVDADDKVYTSESGWSYGQPGRMWNQSRSKGSGNWGQSSRYQFRGFVYNPAITAKIGNRTGQSSSSSGGGKTDRSKVWKGLRSKGLNSKAAAGVMGCWQAESSNNPDTVEGFYLKGYPGNDKVFSSRSAMSNWCTGPLFSAYARQGLSINRKAYKGGDGYYYPGMGLAGWTGPMARKLFDYASSIHKNPRTLNAQIGYFWKTFGQKTNLINRMENASSPQDAATMFLDGYEMYPGWAANHSSQNAKRRNYAKEIYNTYAGSGSGIPITYNFTDPKNNPFGYTGGSSDIVTNQGTSINDADNTLYKVNNPSARAIAKLRKYNSYMANSTKGGNIYINADQINKILEYIKLIAENTTSNKLIGRLVELQNDMVSLLADVSSVKVNSSSKSASEDFAKSIENDIANMKAKLDNIAQTL